MSTCHIQLGPKGPVVTLELLDFNRLRWAIAALRTHAALRHQLTTCGQAHVRITDSIILHRRSTPPAPGQWVIHWDGLNSLVELQHHHPQVSAQAGLRHLYVGYFADLAPGFPPDSLPLFDETLNTFANTELSAPWWFDATCWARATVRMWQNRKQTPRAHRQLQGGGQVVFCGLVTPNATVLDGLLLGSTLTTHRNTIGALEGLQWRGPAAHVEAALHGVHECLQQHALTTPTDAASAFSLINVMQRLATLNALHHLGTPLLVHEFGQGSYIDPYNATGYQRNLFLDFGSTRGPDPIYPRVVDLHLTHKPVAKLRFMGCEDSLQTWLRTHAAATFWQRCQGDAQAIHLQLAHLKATWS